MARTSNPTQSPPATRNQGFKPMLPASCDPPGPNNPATQRVWVIFGGSGHIGRSIVKAALNHGDLVTAVGKLHENTIASMSALVPSLSASPNTLPQSSLSPGNDQLPAGNSPDQHPHPHYLPLVCDVRLPASVAAVFHATIERWGRYDIVANCSGYGVIGACEDQDDADIRGQLETNFFGTLHILQASLPYFRLHGSTGKGHEPEDDEDDVADSSGDESVGSGEDALAEEEADEDVTASSHPAESRSNSADHGQQRRAGRYLIFSSTSGSLGVPGLGPYCATKYAVEGLVESLLYEVVPFGIRATLVEPGYVRRDDPTSESTSPTPPSKGTSRPPAAVWLKPSPSPSPALPTFGHFFIKPASPPYSTPNAPAAHARRVVQWLGDSQPTSAVKAAELVWQLGHCRFPPLRLLLGTYAVESVRDRLRTIIEEMEDWKFLNFGAQAGTEAREKDDPKAAGEGEEGEKGGDSAMDHDGEDVEEEGDDSEDGGNEDTDMPDQDWAEFGPDSSI